MVEKATDIRICSLMSWSLAKVVEEIELIGLLKKKINFFLFLRTNLIRLFAVFPKDLSERFRVSPWNFQDFVRNADAACSVADCARVDSSQPL